MISIDFVNDCMPHRSFTLDILLFAINLIGGGAEAPPSALGTWFLVLGRFSS